MGSEREQLFDAPRMRALTLYQPWAWIVVHGPKRVENRRWAPWPGVIGQRIAIHAGLTYDGDGERFIRSKGIEPPAPEQLDRGAIIGTAIVTGFVRSGDLPGLSPLPADQMPWFFGPVGWLLDDAQVCTPWPCRGALGLWRVPAECPLLEAAA